MNSIKTVHLKTCTSTNDIAWDYAPGPALVVTDQQTKGRGRSGREWVSNSSENLYCSVILKGPRDSAHLTWISLMAGIAAAETLKKTFKAIDLPSAFHLKWPNDLVWTTPDGVERKLGGILCESRTQGNSSGPALVVVGLGLNISVAPEVVDRKTISITEAFQPPRSFDKLKYAQMWADRLISLMEQLDASHGVEPLRRQWKRWARLDLFPDFETHPSGGELFRVHAIDVDSIGRLVCRDQGSDKIFSIS